MQSKVFLMHNYFSAPISVLSTGAWVQILVSLVLWPCNVQMGIGRNMSNSGNFKYILSHTLHTVNRFVLSEFVDRIWTTVHI